MLCKLKSSGAVYSNAEAKPDVYFASGGAYLKCKPGSQIVDIEHLRGEQNPQHYPVGHILSFFLLIPKLIQASLSKTK